MNPFRIFHNAPLSRKLTFSIMGTSMLSVLMIAIMVTAFSIYTERREMRDELSAMARMVGDNSSAALVFGDNFAAEETLNALKVRQSVEMACLYSLAEGVPALFADYRTGSRVCPAQPHDNNVGFKGLVVNVPIELRGNEVGVIHLRQNYDDLWSVTQLYILAVILSVFIAIIIALLMTLKLKAWLSAPILELTSTANRIAQSGDYSLRATNYGSDEVGQLIHRFNDMLQQIQQQNVELIESRQLLEQRVSERTSEIEQAMGHLKEAQNQLIQTEKLAALGGLVAGVAHEINTPVGVGMTASTSLFDHSKEIMELLQSGTLTKEQLFEYAESAMEATDIIVKNLSRAADLVRSFKQVAIDQSGLERRNILINEYIQSLLTSLHPALKKTPHTVEVDCPDDLKVETYPGALSQILTNLIMNSLRHGFDNTHPGHCRISVSLVGDDIRLVYEDDGRGILPEHLPHVFEPFFTSRRNEGGSGLGLHIVHNLVTQTLSGSIRLSSEPGKGVKFVLMLPGKLPRNPANEDLAAKQASAS